MLPLKSFLASVALISACGSVTNNHTIKELADAKKGDSVEIKTKIGSTDYCLYLKDSYKISWQNGCGQAETKWSIELKADRKIPSIDDHMVSFYQTNPDIIFNRRSFISTHNSYSLRNSPEKIQYLWIRTIAIEEHASVDWTYDSDDIWNRFKFVPREGGGFGMVSTLIETMNKKTNDYFCLSGKNYNYESEEENLMGGVQTNIIRLSGKPTTLPSNCAKIEINPNQAHALDQFPVFNSVKTK